MSTEQNQIQEYQSTSAKARYLQEQISELPQRNKWIEGPLSEILDKPYDNIVEKLVHGEINVNDSK